MRSLFLTSLLLSACVDPQPERGLYHFVEVVPQSDSCAAVGEPMEIDGDSFSVHLDGEAMTMLGVLGPQTIVTCTLDGWQFDCDPHDREVVLEEQGILVNTRTFTNEWSGDWSEPDAFEALVRHTATCTGDCDTGYAMEPRCVREDLYAALPADSQLSSWGM